METLKLIQELNKILNETSDLILKLSELNEVSPEIEEKIDYFNAIQNKHIPAEMCSELKLIERIEEAEGIFNDIQFIMSSGSSKGS